MTATEIVFVVEEAPEGGYCARALGASIFAEGDDLSQLQAGVRDAVRCHFDQADAPKVIRVPLRIVPSTTRTLGIAPRYLS